MLIGDELWEYLISKGVEKHEHSNGLFSCYECTLIVATGKSKQELELDWVESCKRIEKDLFGEQ